MCSLVIDGIPEDALLSAENAETWDERFKSRYTKDYVIPAVYSGKTAKLASLVFPDLLPEELSAIQIVLQAYLIKAQSGFYGSHEEERILPIISPSAAGMEAEVTLFFNRALSAVYKRMGQERIAHLTAEWKIARDRAQSSLHWQEDRKGITPLEKAKTLMAGLTVMNKHHFLVIEKINPNRLHNAEARYVPMVRFQTNYRASITSFFEEHPNLTAGEVMSAIHEHIESHVKIDAAPWQHRQYFITQAKDGAGMKITPAKGFNLITLLNRLYPDPTNDNLKKPEPEGRK